MVQMVVLLPVVLLLLVLGRTRRRRRLNSYMIDSRGPASDGDGVALAHETFSSHWYGGAAGGSWKAAIQKGREREKGRSRQGDVTQERRGGRD